MTIPTRLVPLCCVTIFAASANAQIETPLGSHIPRAASSADFNPRSRNTSAIDAKGIRHDGHSYKGNPPWLVDRVGGPAPDYPIEDRRMRHEGRVIVRLTLDLKTGHVVKASLLKSSGYP